MYDVSCLGPCTNTNWIIEEEEESTWQPASGNHGQPSKWQRRDAVSLGSRSAGAADGASSHRPLAAAVPGLDGAVGVSRDLRRRGRQTGAP